MSGIKFSFKLKAAFGSIPTTEKIESTHANLLADYLKFNQFRDSDEFKNFLALEKKVQSDSFKKALDAIKADTFEKTVQYKQWKEFLALKKNSAVKKYHRALNSSDEQKKLTLAAAPEVKKFKELETIINSDEFKKFKAEKEDKERYKRSEEYLELQRYESISKSAEILWYYKTLKASPFTELEKWQLVFDDEFNDKNLDTSKWITNYYYGKAILNEPYSLSTDKHFPTDGKNIEIKNSVLNILTKKESVKGKVWDPKFGFYEKEFQFTSGMISTGDSFRTDVGRFEAKVLLPDSFPVMNSFWLSTGKMLPEINIFNTQANGKIILANHWGPKVQSSVAKLNGSRFLNKWFIFGLEWTKEKLTWTINGIPVREESNGLPNEPMFIVFNSSIVDESGISKLPSSFQIDWVRVYKKVK